MALALVILAIVGMLEVLLLLRRDSYLTLFNAANAIVSGSAIIKSPDWQGTISEMKNKCA